jgi:hypothetical protein
MKQILFSLVAISILDTHDPNKVQVCAENEERIICVQADRAELERPSALDAIADFLSLKLRRVN